MSSIGKIRRILGIIEHLQSGRRYHTGQLSELLGASKRTIFRDLNVLLESGVQLLYDDSAQGYWIPAKTIVPHSEMTFEEILSLIVLGDGVSNADHGVPFQLASRNAALKILACLPESTKAIVSRIIGCVHIRVVKNDKSSL